MSYIRIKANEDRAYDQIVKVDSIDSVYIQADPDESKPWEKAQAVTLLVGKERIILRDPAGGTMNQLELYRVLKGSGMHESVEGFTNFKNVVKIELGPESEYEIWPPSEKLWYCYPTLTFASGETGNVFISNRELRVLLEANWTNV